jgi:hypothetical protein
MSSSTPFDLSNATCYYRTKASRWNEEFGNIMVILVGVLMSMTGSFGAKGTIMWMSP